MSTAVLIAALLLMAGAALVLASRRRSHRVSPVGAIVLAMGVVLAVVGLGAHSASAATTAGDCAPTSPAQPTSVDATAITRPATTTTPTDVEAAAVTPPASLPESPLPVAVLVAGFGTGAIVLRRRVNNAGSAS